MTRFKMIMQISGAVAVLCVLVFPVWILGVPGVQNNYARGWTFGLNALMLYPFLWFCNAAAYFLVRNRISDDAQVQRQKIGGIIALLLLIAFVFCIIRAFQIMK